MKKNSPKKFSNTEIDKLGIKIREQSKEQKLETLNKLQEFRTSHKNSLSEIFHILLKIKNSVDKKSIVTYRIKRFESIIGKLRRYQKMKLSRMWDIGGCRVIFDNNKDVYDFKEKVSSVLKIRKEYDYIKNPQKDGYKSLHLFVESPIENDSRVIEIQLRNQQDHNWATLVEISDLLFDSELKELSKNKTLLRFHLLLSKEHLEVTEKKEIAKIVNKYKYIDKLNSVFVRNYLNVRLQWLFIENEYRHKFFLIETSKNNIPIIEAFDNFRDAETHYFNKFKINTNANVVLTYILKPTFEQISVAYSNYMLTMHSCIDDFSDLFESLVVDSLKANKKIDFIKYFGQYQDLSLNKHLNLIKEATYSDSVNQKYLSKLDLRLSRKLEKKIRKKDKEWKDQIKSKLKKSDTKIRNFHKIYRENQPKSKIQKYIIKKITKYSVKKYNKKFSKILAKNH